jgi:hypothetical protein
MNLTQVLILNAENYKDYSAVKKKSGKCSPVPTISQVSGLPWTAKNHQNYII